MISTFDYFEKIFFLARPDLLDKYQVYKIDPGKIDQPNLEIYAAIFDRPFYEEEALLLSDPISVVVSKKWVLQNISKIVEI